MTPHPHTLVTSPQSRLSTPAGRRQGFLRQRRGAAAAVVVLLLLAVSGLGLMTMRQGQQGVTLGVVNTDAQRALQVADACAAGAVKALPALLETYLMMIRDSGDRPPIIHEQFDHDFFGDDPYGDSPRHADCVVQLVEIADDAPAPGYSEGGGCFKRITLQATASLSRRSPSGVESTDITQRQAETVREVVVRGLFGPVSCF